MYRIDVSDPDADFVEYGYYGSGGFIVVSRWMIPGSAL